LSKIIICSSYLASASASSVSYSSSSFFSLDEKDATYRTARSAGAAGTRSTAFQLRMLRKHNFAQFTQACKCHQHHTSVSPKNLGLPDKVHILISHVCVLCVCVGGVNIKVLFFVSVTPSRLQINLLRNSFLSFRTCSLP
jgi:hypothetical protein